METEKACFCPDILPKAVRLRAAKFLNELLTFELAGMAYDQQQRYLTVRVLFVYSNVFRILFRENEKKLLICL